MPPKFTGQRAAEGMGPRMITIVTAQVKVELLPWQLARRYMSFHVASSAIVCCARHGL
jgi:hypothetical protein